MGEDGAGVLAEAVTRSIIDEIAESFCAFGHRLARVLNLGRGVPQDVELEVCRGPVNRALKRCAALPHGLLGNRQRIFWLRPICRCGRVTPPDPRLELIPGNLPGSADSTIVVARLDLRKGSPAIHRLELEASAKDQHNCSEGGSCVHAGKHCGVTDSRSYARKARLFDFAAFSHRRPDRRAVAGLCEVRLGAHSRLAGPGRASVAYLRNVLVFDNFRVKAASMDLAGWGLPSGGGQLRERLAAAEEEAVGLGEGSSKRALRKVPKIRSRGSVASP